YILLYVIKKTPLLKQVINKLKEELNVKVILCEQGIHFDNVVDEHIRDAGPKDFISLFNNAKFVVTDSFHGTTFSLIFNKPFFSVSPGANVNRISSLLELVGLDSRI
ncbi:polysaccharide pyruvyl transferase, partial [Vibrio parahaemolyticus]